MSGETPPLVLGGRFRLEREVGRGGMGAVFEALDLARNERVAVKLLDPAHQRDAAARACFTHEAAIAQRLTSVHAPHVLFVAEDDGDLDTPAFFVMEYLFGTTLERMIDTTGSIAPRRAVSLAIEVLDVLGELHRHGFVHRDVKPGNVFVSEGGNAKLLDFGLSTAIGSAPGDAGTLAFMAPEQAEGAALDERTDVYALSATLHRALTGSLVFAPDPIGRFYDALANTPPPRANVDQALDAIVLRGLAKKPKDRFASASELRDALASWLERQ
ncbi:hypothetical protein BH09MYX1_BH09MYX1_55440 [soil metagenome]